MLLGSIKRRDPNSTVWWQIEEKGKLRRRSLKYSLLMANSAAIVESVRDKADPAI
jgi:hypothetical protein